MSGFACECFRCGIWFTGPDPRAVCLRCRPLAAAEVVSALLKAFGRSWQGTTPEDFDAQVHNWLETVKQPHLDKLYVDLVQ